MSWSSIGIDVEIKASKEKEVEDEEKDKYVVTLNDENFDNIVNDEEKNVLVKFYQPGCGFCKQMSKISINLCI